MAYPHKWSPISYKSSAGQRKHIGQRPMLYRWTMPPSPTVKHYTDRMYILCDKILFQLTSMNSLITHLRKDYWLESGQFCAVHHVICAVQVGILCCQKS